MFQSGPQPSDVCFLDEIPLTPVVRVLLRFESNQSLQLRLPIGVQEGHAGVDDGPAVISAKRAPE
jgi:hypothetical protein